MTQDERLLAQRELLSSTKKLTMENICEYFSISRDSARRDLIKLAQLPDVQRVRGGAILVAVKTVDLPYLHRSQMSSSKMAIGKIAAELVKPDDYIILDAGTSLTAMASQLKTAAHVVTNSVDCLALLADRANINVHLLGGQLNTHHRAIFGPTAVQQLSAYRVNKVFLGVCALSEFGLSSANEDEAHIKQAMIAQAQQVILLCDSSKFAQQNLYQIGPLDKVDILITDQSPPQNLLVLLNKHEIEIIIANEMQQGADNV
ncbi:MAG: DeoR/GlpR family transcriptional regulator of sugar metabolism [Psychromonas sp.]|jgi:DeoR/GlpR family transcriptional regulator of sugar metabolism|uniref:DeoR/GlpR family DNA-binding transcription regulator n=1 Tax=Psychromonas sp. TaxID=1884585 RepID=UPI0039E32A32